MAVTAHTQTGTPTPSVDVCQLTRNPGLYIGKQVAVSGRVTQGFEDFSVRDEHCTSFQNRVTLAYGDMKENVEYWKHFFHVELPDTTFLDDSEAKHLKDLLRAFRVFAPNGDECGPERCSFFRVSATLTGRFIAKKSANTNYIGSCCVLIIERVSGVNATRTEVPFGSVYRCEEQEWHPTATETTDLANSDSQQTVSRDPRAARLHMFSRIAQHWHDPDIADGNPEIGTGGWTSPDLLRRYTIRQIGKAEGPIVTRQVCRASADLPPKEISPDFGCSHKYWQESSPSQASPQPSEEPKLASVARNAISAAMASWHTPLPDLVVNVCKQESDGNSGYGQCSFTTQDGTVSVWVELVRWQKREKHAQWTGIPWTSRVRGAFCSQ